MSLYFESLLGLAQKQDKDVFLQTQWYYNYSTGYWELDYWDSFGINKGDEPVEFEQYQGTIPKIVKFRSKEYLLIYIDENDSCTGHYVSKDFILSQFNQ